MSKLIIENLNLLNKMHEGLIVVSEKERTLKFASKPAINYLNSVQHAKNIDNSNGKRSD